MKKIVVLGSEGQVGRELQRTLATLGHVIAWDRRAADLTKIDTVIKALRDVKPHIIVNAAAYTAVDLAEKEQDIAMSVNGIAPGAIAEESKRLGSLFVHYSTDYVFDGRSTKPYTEKDSPAPQNIYGITKLAGEKAIQTVGGRHLILRTAWVYGTYGKNFLLTMLKLAKERDQLKIVADQVGAPTWSRLIAQATAHILLQNQDISGLYHLTTNGQVSWNGFAQEIFHCCKARWPEFRSPEVIAIPSIDYPTPAQRPHYSVLSNEKVQKDFSLVMPEWNTGLKLCINDLYR